MEKKCIVLADKNQFILEGIRGLLETLEADVVMVADWPSLQNVLNQMKPEIAVIDLALLGLEKTHNAHELHQHLPALKMIVLSEYDEPDIVNEIMEAGVSAFVLRQHAGNDLFDAIERIQKGQHYISPAIKTVWNSQEDDGRTSM